MPNPNPGDIEVLDAKPVSMKNVEVDWAGEAKRLALKREAQELAGITQNPKSDHFVFVGRLSKRNGVDLIADVVPVM